MVEGFELVTESEDCTIRSSERKLLQNIQVINFTLRKVVFGSAKEHCTSEIRLTYTAPNHGREMEWVHDTSLAALQISEGMDIIRNERLVASPIRDV